ncbi:MAG: S41 family peptidase [Vicinamibacteria bacterium]|nr:S41 family peptidase [Vicinamibacteria bacterium]
MRRLGAICASVVVITTVLGGWLGGRVLAREDRLEDHVRLFSGMLAAIEREYVSEVKSDRLISSSINEMLRTLDPHSRFLEPRENTYLQERQRGSYHGLGISVVSVEGNITVVAPFEGTPAHRLGIRAGDIISRIDGVDARGMNLEDAVRKLKGPKGTSVRVTIVRQGYDTPLEFTVIRDEIPLHSVPYDFMVTPTTGYIRLTDFNETTACRGSDPPTCERELERALGRLSEQGARSIILDIRDNPGGLLDQALAVANLILPKGKLIVFTRGRTKRDETDFVTEGPGRFADVPLVLLVSRHSASASEIVAGAVQDHDRGLTVGERTFGKGLVQTVMPLRSGRGYALALTTARYYTPSGRLIQREYASTALEDYFSPTRRSECGENLGEAQYTDAGRRVFGGDGIGPDFCVAPEASPKILSYLDARRAFFDFSMRYENGDDENGRVSSAGERPDNASERIMKIHADFEVDEAVFLQFRDFLREREIRFDEEELEEHREALSRRILEEVLRQVFGEGLARRRTLQWDPQVQKALEVMPLSEQLLKSPKEYIADRAIASSP